MPTSKLQRVQVDPLIDVETGWPFARLPLSPAQWDEISNLSSIPKAKTTHVSRLRSRLECFDNFKRLTWIIGQPPKSERAFAD
jgi:hypothetical protein